MGFASDQDGERRPAMDTALRYLTPRARSVQEMRMHLIRKGVGPGIAEEVIAELQQRGLLDDRDFASNYIQWRLRSRPAGTRRVAHELHRKGIPAEIVDQVISESAEALDSVSTAVSVLRRQHRRYAGLEWTAACRRMLGMLGRRGYEQHIARTAVDMVWEEWHRHESN